MKLCLVLVVPAILTVAVVGAKRCMRDVDCKEDECCLAKKHYYLGKGYCRARVTEGKRCSRDEDKLTIFHGKFFRNCNCAEGLECRAEEDQSLSLSSEETLKKLKCYKRNDNKETDAPVTDADVITAERDQTEAEDHTFEIITESNEDQGNEEGTTE